MPQVVVDNSAAKKRQRRIKMIVLGGVFLVVVGVGAFLAAQYFAPKPMDPTLALLIKGRISYDDPKSQQRLEQAAAHAARTQDKITLLQQAGGMAAANKHYEQADADYLKAVSLGDVTAGTATQMAENYYRNLHRNVEALKYYKLALSRTKADGAAGRDPYADRQVAYLEKQIQELEK